MWFFVVCGDLVRIYDFAQSIAIVGLNIQNNKHHLFRIKMDNSKEEFDISCHTNQSVGEVKQRLAHRLSVTQAKTNIIF